MDIIITKKCRSCGIEKELKDFDTKAYGRLGTTASCTVCRDRFRDRINERVERTKERNKEYKKKNNNARRYSLKNKYGIDIEQYDNILEKQNNLCAICGKPNDGKKSFSVDHDHKTNKVRGLLCTSCNLGLGNFKDTIKLLASAARYLIKNK